MMYYVGMEECDTDVEIDACLTGCGGVFNERYYHSIFPEFVLAANRHIAQLEMLNIVIACKLWGKYWTGLSIAIKCDNNVCVHVLNNGRCHDAFLLKCAREIWLRCALNDFSIRAVHISTSSNSLADSLSRWHINDSHKQFFASQQQSKNISIEEPVDPYMFILVNDL